MATKKQKREAAEAKRAAFMAQVKAEGLAALRAEHRRQKEREAAIAAVTSGLDRRYRHVLLMNGVNPSTGLPFTDKEMEEMKAKVDASRSRERRHLYYQIEAGRAALLREQPVLSEMTIGDLRDRLDQD